MSHFRRCPPGKSTDSYKRSNIGFHPGLVISIHGYSPNSVEVRVHLVMPQSSYGIWKSLANELRDTLTGRVPIGVLPISRCTISIHTTCSRSQSIVLRHTKTSLMDISASYGWD